MKSLRSWIVAIALIIPAAVAAKVYLNGVDITGVRNQVFTKVKKVRIDANGDIHLEAPQYDVKVAESPASGAAAPASQTTPSGSYFLVTQGKGRLAQFDITVIINGVERMRIPAKDASEIQDITPWLRKGENQIVISAKKNLAGGRKSTSAHDRLTVLIGEGHVENKVVKIDRIRAKFECNASQTADFAKQYTISIQ